MISRWQTVAFKGVLPLCHEFHFTGKLNQLLLPRETRLPGDIRVQVLMAGGGGGASEPCRVLLFVCLHVCAQLLSPGFRPLLWLAADHLERLRCVKQDGFISFCLSEPGEAAVL